MSKRVIAVSDDEDDVEDLTTISARTNSESLRNESSSDLSALNNMKENRRDNAEVFSPNHDGWIDSRNVHTISEAERQSNVRKAFVERKKHKSKSKEWDDKNTEKNVKRIKKKPKLDDFVVDDDEMEEEEDVNNSPFAAYAYRDSNKTNKIDFKSKLISSSLDDIGGNDKFKQMLEDRKRKLQGAREERLVARASVTSTDEGNSKKNFFQNSMTIQTDKNDKKVLKRTIVLDNSEEEEDEDTDNSDGTSGSSGNDSGEESETEEQRSERRQQEAEKIVEKCEQLSDKLRKSLQLWSGTSNDIKKDSERRDCVDLINIEKDTTSSSLYRLLEEEDIQTMCPDLILKPYQLVGVNWMRLLHENKMNGVLADDMGLGKTVQAIAFLGWLRSAQEQSFAKKNAHLIVVPASTLANWQNEIARFCPSFSVITYHGSQNERIGMKQAIKTGIKKGEIDVVLSTYTIFERESSWRDRQFLQKQVFQYMILDEGHCVKNSGSARFINLNAMRMKLQ